MTLGYEMQFSAGRIAAGEYDQVFRPRTPRVGTCGVILLHGADNPRAYIDPDVQPSSVRLAGRLASAGFPCIAGDMAGNAWGNDTAMARVDSAWAYLRSQYPTMRADKVVLIGGSMGGLTAARYSQLNPSKVAAVVGLIPVLDLVALYTSNYGGIAAQIAGVYGVTAPAALPTSADIAARAKLAASVPLLAGYSTADLVALPQWVTSYVGKINDAGGSARAVITDTTAGHSDAAIGGMPIDTVAQFIAAWGA